jgi:branched-subunit amino acid aminotransferase/4-amino-4-deoxychorismate lyase
MRSYGGVVFRLGQHLARIRGSCDALFIPLQFKDEVLKAAVAELLQRNGLSDARLRMTVTRGLARQDPLHGLHLEPTVLLTAAELEPYPADYYSRGMTVIVIDEQKLNPYDLQAGHKTLNYFSRLAALREANRRAAGEALWFNVHNYLQSGSISNVFIVKGGEILTPPTAGDLLDAKVAESVAYPKSAVLPGVMRAAVMEIASHLGISARPASISIEELLEAEEVFLTNSIMGIMPVCRIERRAIGDDKPGAITRQLSRNFEQLIGTEINPRRAGG